MPYEEITGFSREASALKARTESVTYWSLLSGLLLACASLRLISTQLTPGMVNLFQPNENAPGFSVGNDPPIGTQVPTELSRVRRPFVAVVHGACLSCSLSAFRKAEAAFDARGVVNVVAAEPETYENLIRKHKGDPILVVPPTVGAKLNSPDAPRVYAFDLAGRLVYVQGDNEELRDAINEGTRKIVSR